MVEVHHKHFKTTTGSSPAMRRNALTYKGTVCMDIFCFDQEIINYIKIEYSWK